MPRPRPPVGRPTDPILAEMQRIVRLAADLLERHDNIKSAIAVAARRLGLSYRRARSFWYADRSTKVLASEADRLRAVEPELLREQRLRLEAALTATNRQLGDICRRLSLERRKN